MMTSTTSHGSSPAPTPSSGHPSFLYNATSSPSSPSPVSIPASTLHLSAFKELVGHTSPALVRTPSPGSGKDSDGMSSPSSDVLQTAGTDYIGSFQFGGNVSVLAGASDRAGLLGGLQVGKNMPVMQEDKTIDPLHPSFSFLPANLSLPATHPSSPVPFEQQQRQQQQQPFHPLDDFKFPASTFASPALSQAPVAARPSEDWESSIIKAPALPSIPRFPSSFAHSPSVPHRAPSKAIQIKNPRGAAHDGAAPVAARNREALMVVASPKRDAYEIAAEQGRMRAGLGAATQTGDNVEDPSPVNNPALRHETSRLSLAEQRARGGPAVQNYSMHSDYFKPASPSLPSLPSPTVERSQHLRSQTAPVDSASFNLSRTLSLAHLGVPASYDGCTRTPSPIGPSFAQTEAERQKAQLALYLSAQVERSDSRTPAGEHQRLRGLTHSGIAPSTYDGSNLSSLASSSATDYNNRADPQIADLIAALRLQIDKQSHPSSAGNAASSQPFSVNVDFARQQSTFAPSSFGSASAYSPGLGPSSPLSTTSTDAGSDLATRLQAIRFLHPGVFGSHSGGGRPDFSGSGVPQSAGAYDGSAPAAEFGAFNPQQARANGADPAALAKFLGATGLGHGINPIVMDPALQKYLIDHNLPLDGPSPTNKKASKYKTELCRSWEKNVNAATAEERCQYGNKCQYAHGTHELRPVERHPKYKTQICTTFWLLGQCAYGRRCCFLHNDIPLGGIPELGDLGTQEALRSILKARLSLASAQDVGDGLDLSGVPQAYFGSNGIDASQLANLAPAGRYNPSAHRPLSTLHDFGSSTPYSRPSYASTPYAERAATAVRGKPPALLRPRDRSDSLSVNMAPVPELTPIPPSLPIAAVERTPPRPYVPGTPSLLAGMQSFGAATGSSNDRHAQALAAVQATHTQGLYSQQQQHQLPPPPQMPARRSPNPQDPVMPRVVPGRPNRDQYPFTNPWEARQPAVGAIGDRATRKDLANGGGQKPIW